jgi:hypothetical protein
MELARYVDDLRHQLLVAADAGGDDARLLAERLVAPLEAATRLILLDALSAAADEITTELAPGSVDVRIRGLEPEFVVTSPPAEVTAPDVTTAATVPERVLDAPAPRPAISTPVGDADDASTSRITLRLPEHLKGQVEQAASFAGLSVNAWLVRAATDALDPHVPSPPPKHNPLSGQHLTGWVR